MNADSERKKILRETTEHMIERTRKQADLLTAHLDEGGKFNATNILGLIADVLDLGNRLEKAEAERDSLRREVGLLKDFCKGVAININKMLKDTQP